MKRREDEIDSCRGVWCPLARMACPGSADPRAGKRGWCPAWMSGTMVDPVTEQEFRKEGCALRILPHISTAAFQAAETAARESSEARARILRVDTKVGALQTSLGATLFGFVRQLVTVLSRGRWAVITQGDQELHIGPGPATGAKEIPPAAAEDSGG